MENKEKSKGKIIILSIIVILVVLLFARYIADKSFREFVDIKFLGKQVFENNLNFIEINSEDNPTCFAFDNYIGVIAKNELTIYNNKGEEVNSLSINVPNPIIDTNGKFAVIADKDGNRFYVVNSTSLLFQNKIDGKIDKISINKNGYISIVASNSTYNSIVIVYDNDNNELFKKFLPSTYAMCSYISDTNNYLAIGEVDYRGTVIKSYVKIIDVKTAKDAYEFSSPENEILVNISYDEKDIAICSFSNSIYKVEPNNSNKLYDITDENSFINIDMKNTIGIVERESSGLFSYEYKLKLKSTTSSNENIYILEKGLPKTTIGKENYIALNYGNEVYVVNHNGSLKKYYVSDQQIKDLMIGSHICGIVYKDKIEIISL